MITVKEYTVFPMNIIKAPMNTVKSEAAVVGAVEVNPALTQL